MNKKTIFLFMAALLTLLSANAQPISEQEALVKAQQFFSKASLSSAARGRAPRKAPELKLANNRSEFFAFNDEANGGYVVVSGDERMPDVLAYSYDGHFDADNMPCNMQAWLDGYAEQVKYLQVHPEAKLTRRSATERENVSPLLTCCFDQISPYNNKCPEVDGKHCATGCAATAMAQVLHYWQWPKQTTDVIPGYTTLTLKIEMPAIPVTTIDWDNILDCYYPAGNESDKQKDAIATLMLLCGTSLHMDYTSSGSGSGYCGKPLRYYFGYDELLEEISRDNYNTEEWEQLIYDELNSKRPVIYSGFSDAGGHEFVMDGYENGYFHVNWGWGWQGDYVLMTDVGGWNRGQYAVVGVQPANPNNPSRYAVFDNGKMKLYYDKEQANRSGIILTRKEYWENYKKDITECIIDPSFASIKSNSLSSFFCGWENLKSIKGLENLNTSSVKNLNGMFKGCSSLTTLDLGGFKTDNVTSMDQIFTNCSSLTNLDVSGFKTNNVTNMYEMFFGCKSLKNLDLSGFETGNVTNMNGMFAGCESLKKLDLSGFETHNVTDMSRMFISCYSLRSLDVSGFNTQKVTEMWRMFQGCESLNKLDVSGFKTDNVTDMSNMFQGCIWLQKLDLSGFETHNVTDMSDMFNNCSSLTRLDLSGFKTSNVSDMGRMFYNCNHLSTIYVSERWDMSNISTANSTDHMFGNCYSIIGSAGTTYDANHIDGKYARIDKGSVAPGYFTEKVPQYYTITYMLNGEEYMSQYFKVGAAITAIEDPIIEGYTFVEWNDEIPEIMPAHDVVITGTLTANKYTITYIIEGEVFMIDSLAYGSTIIFPEVPEREGYTIHWYWDGQIMPAYDITIWGTYVSGIGTLYMKDEDEKWFTIEGKRTETPRKGLNIVHTSSVKKVVVK